MPPSLGWRRRVSTCQQPTLTASLDLGRAPANGGEAGREVSTVLLLRVVGALPQATPACAWGQCRTGHGQREFEVQTGCHAMRFQPSALAARLGPQESVTPSDCVIVSALAPPDCGHYQQQAAAILASHDVTALRSVTCAERHSWLAGWLTTTCPVATVQAPLVATRRSDVTHGQYDPLGQSLQSGRPPVRSAYLPDGQAHLEGSSPLSTSEPWQSSHL